MKRISGEIVIRIHGLSQDEFNPNTGDGDQRWYKEYAKRVTDAMVFLAKPGRNCESFNVGNSLYWEVLREDEEGESHWVRAMGYYQDGKLILKSLDEFLGNDDGADETR